MEYISFDYFEITFQMIYAKLHTRATTSARI